jgi:predicted Zn-dependent protease
MPTNRLPIIPKCSSIHRAVLLITVVSTFACEFVPKDVASLRGSGRVHFVTLGEFPLALRDSLAEHYSKKYKLQIEMLPGLTLDSDAMDAQRHQLIAEKAIRLVKQAYPSLAEDSQSIVIGLTAQDMYISKKNWRFAFSYRADDRFAIVSCGRMHLGLSANQSQEFEARIRKMVTKNIGVLYYHLPQSIHPRSVMYGAIGGIEELDFMGEDF